MQQITVAVTLFVALLAPITQAVKTFDTGAGKVFKLNVQQDVTIESPTVNHNALKWLLVAKHPGYPNKRALLKFEDLPVKQCPLYSIKWAKMYLYFDYAHKASTYKPSDAPEINRYLNVHVMKKAWNEAQATAKYRVRGTPWSVLAIGIDGSDADTCAQCGIVTMFPARPSGFVEFDITGAVQSWAQGLTNNGVVVHAINELEAGRDLRFASNKEADKEKHAFVHVLCT